MTAAIVKPSVRPSVPIVAPGKSIGGRALRLPQKTAHSAEKDSTMSNLFDVGLRQWFVLETAAVRAAEEVKNNADSLQFYGQLAQCAAEQAEVANASQRQSAIQYLRSQLERLEELLQLKDELEEKARAAREASNTWRDGLREVANF